MNEADDRYLELLFSFFRDLDRKAPGSEASTRNALTMLGDLPQHPETVDLGCGSGCSALALAQAGARVVALDIHWPFLRRVNDRAAESGMRDRIRAVCGDMAEPPFALRAFDLVWSEGAIYIPGFETGLKKWRDLLRPGGYLAVTELTWLSSQPSREIVDFWSHAYPAMSTVDRNLESLREAGVETVGHFALPREDWADYLDPVQEQLLQWRKDSTGDAAVDAFLDDTQQEIDMWRKYGDQYGYVFYLGRVA